MASFSAIALDRFLDSGASNSPSPVSEMNTDDQLPRSTLDRRNTTTSFSSDDLKSTSKRHDFPPVYPPIRRSNSTVAPVRKPPLRPQISPALLYATPETTPLPDSPTSSFSPSSPYIINHKRRGPRLRKSFSDKNVAAISPEKDLYGGEKESKLTDIDSRSLSEENLSCERIDDENLSRGLKVKTNGSRDSNVNVNVMVEDVGEGDDFFEPRESLSYMSNNEGDDIDWGVDTSARMYTPMGGEFFDAWEELSSDSGRQVQRTIANNETELREMRLSLLMEIEMRKQAEEVLNSMCGQWHNLREKLRVVGLILPAELSTSSEDCQSDVDPTEEICQQIQLTRFVSESIGKGVAKAEAEAEMEKQLQTKNFEIARLSDRLHYYEAMNREMSQRNQEAIEVARRER